jgi:hypothetical protein
MSQYAPAICPKAYNGLRTGLMDTAVRGANLCTIQSQRFESAVHENPPCLRLRPGASEPELLVEDRTLDGIDGITFLGRELYVNNVISNNLYRIPLDRAGKAGSPVQIWPDRPISGPDGMRAYIMASYIWPRTGTAAPA